VTPTLLVGELEEMGALSREANGDQQAGGRFERVESSAALDASVDFERYREVSCARFKRLARTMGFHVFHDLDELAQDFYDDFWTEWLARPSRELSGSPVSYISGAMMNKLRDLSRRGRSVRAPELVRSDGEEILARIAAEDLEPAEQVVLKEEMWLVGDIVRTLPPREQVVLAAVVGRDSKRKDAPVGGYKLAAAQLGVSERTAKKLSLQANRRIGRAVEQVESGSWCERWAASIARVAAGEPGSSEFLRHAEHCVQCRLGVAHLRRHAAFVPLPVLLDTQHAGLLGRLWQHLTGGLRSARDQLAGLAGRHASTASDATGLVGAGSGAAGAGATAIKIGFVCVGLAATGVGARVCLQAAGVPIPLGSGAHAPSHRRHSQRTTARLASQSRFISRPAGPALAQTTTSVTHPVAARTASAQHAARAHSASTTHTTSEAQSEFNLGGGSGATESTNTARAAMGHASSSTTATTASASTSGPVERPASKPASKPEPSGSSSSDPLEGP
jgi:DNA-directed RNA polymerase specialized sigma24 family protein